MRLHPSLSQKVWWLGILAFLLAGAGAGAVMTGVLVRELLAGRVATTSATVLSTVGLGLMALLFLVPLRGVSGHFALAWGWLQLGPEGLTVARLVGLRARTTPWEEVGHVELRPSFHRGVVYGTRLLIWSVAAGADADLLDVDALFSAEVLRRIEAGARARGVNVSGAAPPERL